MRYTSLLAILFLCGCSLFSKTETEVYLCPKTGFVAAADHLSLMAPDGKAAVANVHINSFNGDCSARGNTVEMNLTLSFVAHRGVSETAPKEQDFPYFIAILSPEEKILQRRAFATKISFDDAGLGSSNEEHTLEIPVADMATAHLYKVTVGFALTPAQLEQNRKHI